MRPLQPLSDINEMTRNSGRSSHCRTDKMRPPSGALTAFEITVRRGRAMFSRPQSVGIHCKTHRTSRITPFKSSLAEDHIQTLAFGLFFDQTRAWNNHRLDD